LVEHRSPKPGVGSSSLSSRANTLEMKKLVEKVVSYFKETYDELVHKVSWPTYSELTNSAVVVLYASLLIAVVVFVMDLCFQTLMEDIIYPH
jgi:preprotein translocase subunit SecE